MLLTRSISVSVSAIRDRQLVGSQLMIMISCSRSQPRADPIPHTETEIGGEWRMQECTNATLSGIAVPPLPAAVCCSAWTNAPAALHCSCLRKWRSRSAHISMSHSACTCPSVCFTPSLCLCCVDYASSLVLSSCTLRRAYQTPLHIQQI